MNHPTITEQLEAPEDARKAGRRKMAWARQHMPIMRSIGEAFAAQTPLAGETVAMAMHVEAKTAVLTEVLAEAGAEV
ncbi:adenosylhomocysteinase, partial [Halobacteriales archaeon QS_1_68_44]